MTNNSIKLAIKALNAQIDHCHDTIKVLMDERKEMESKCPHDEGFEDITYSPRIAQFWPAKQCKICGKIELEESLLRPETSSEISDK